MNDDYVETGLVPRTVTATATPIAADHRSTQPAVIAPAPPATPPTARAMPMPDGWTLHKVAALVGDVAQNMYEMPYILKKHELTKEQYATLENNEFFQKALEAEIITWQGANSIQKRLMLEAAIGAEAAMPTLAARMQSKTEPLGDIVALMKLFSEMAGVTGVKAAGGPSSFGERFKIVINLGSDSLQKEASPSVDPKIIEHSPA